LKEKYQIMVFERVPALAKPSDKYGLKRLFRELNEWARCPECNTFLVWKDEKTFMCKKCGFEKPATPRPTLR